MLQVPTVIDIEASGFGRGSYPIEVGYVLPDGTRACMLIRPAAHWTHWDPAAERLHRISRETLLECGHPIPEVVEALNARLYGRTAYSDGWAQDYSRLAALYDAAHRVPSFRLENLRALLTEDETARWHLTKQQQVANEMALERHRASADARLLQATWMHVRAQTLASGSATPDRLSA
ncbi:MAG: hypothetical protein ACXWKD_09615 [Caldimonas sp.]